MNERTPRIAAIKALAKKYFPDAVAIRRHLHTHPELSFEEFETAKFIAAQLSAMGVAYQPNVGGNGIVAMVHGRNPETKTIALRGDMDALPIHEKNNIDYRSQNDGVMHACGHDAHTASLLGVVRILHELREEWDGTVKFIFQPAEEKIPGGASIMIAEGALRNPTPAAIIGQHVYPPLDAGKVGFRAGRYMASSDELYVKVRGAGGHGALPQEAVDTVLITAHILVALQTLVSRNADPTVPTVLSFGKVVANGATNIIPEEVEIEGTFRTFDEAWRLEAHKRMISIAEGIASAMGGSVEFNILRGYPVLNNDEPLTNRVIGYAREFLGKENVVNLPIRMTTEDFAHYSHVLPAVFYRLGTNNPTLDTHHPLHSAQFNIDEAAIETGMGLMTYLALKELEYTGADND